MTETAEVGAPRAQHVCGKHPGSNYCDTCKVRSLAVCAALDPNELHELDEIVHHIHIEGKSTFIHQGETAESVFSVTEGVVRLYKLLSDGRRQIIGFAMPGDFLGLALQNRYGFSADAVDAVALFRFDRR